MTDKNDSKWMTVRPERLTDGSLVYNVTIGNLVFECISEDDAIDFTNNFQSLVNEHTNTEVAARWLEEGQ